MRKVQSKDEKKLASYVKNLHRWAKLSLLMSD